MSTACVRPARHPDMMFKQLGSEVVVLNRANNQFHVLNASAALIFESCTGDCTLEMIAGRMAACFGVPIERALSDIRETVAGMEKLGLVLPQAGPGREYAQPSMREITEKDFNESVAGGAALACRSLLGA